MSRQTLRILLHVGAIATAVVSASAQQPDSGAHRMPGMPMPADTSPMAMSMEGPLGISMERSGSGTTWIPDAVILPSRHFMAGAWMVMLHGFLFGQYDYQEGPRGDKQWGS